MDKELKVAFLGVKPNGNDEWMSEVGIRTYTMKVETAIDAIQYSHKGRLSNDVVPGLPTPEKEIQVMAGGRTMMFFQREQIKDLLKGVDLLIMAVSSDYYYVYSSFMMWLTPDNIPDSCTIVIRVPFGDDEQSYYKFELNQWLKPMSLTQDGDVVLGKKKKKKGKFNEKRTLFFIGMESCGGVNPEESIPLLRSHLLKENVTEQLVQPVKETVSAGKSLFGLGKSLTNWVSRLMKTN